MVPNLLSRNGISQISFLKNEISYNQNAQLLPKFPKHDKPTKPWWPSFWSRDVCSTVTVAYCKKALNKTNRWWWVFYEAPKHNGGKLIIKIGLLPICHRVFSHWTTTSIFTLYSLRYNATIVEPCETLRLLPKVKYEVLIFFPGERSTCCEVQAQISISEYCKRSFQKWILVRRERTGGTAGQIYI